LNENDHWSPSKDHQNLIYVAFHTLSNFRPFVLFPIVYAIVLMRPLFASVQVISFPVYGCGEGLLFRGRDLSLITVVYLIWELYAKDIWFKKML